jgi:WD40 repeat protein/tRNA A-37 threonylcarbamoyl transferase component Bud32
VPGYQILAELGRGGMGVVYKACQTRLHRLVALKMILAGSHAREDDLARFSAEAEAVAGLRHPNIIQIYDVGEQDGLPYFSLEFVEGGTLADRLDGTPWQAPRAAELVETLARAVHAAHEKGIIHRDLKPGNVLLTADGTPKITDFGLAKRLDQQSDRTRTGTIMGTPSYMAPEQAGGRRDQLGPVTDAYALGAILYELLTGRPPFQGPTPLDTVLQVVNQEPVPVRQLQPRVPRDLETVCLKCLQKDPARRYPSGVELAEDLRRFRAGEPIRARPVGGLEKLQRWCRRNPLVAGLTLTAAVLLLAGTAVSTFFAAEADRRAKDAARRLYIADLRQVQQAWQLGQLDRVRGLLDGQDLRGFEWDFWDRQWHQNLSPLRGHRWPINGVGVSPDGKQLASAGADQTVKIWNLESGRVIHSLEEHKDAVYGVAYSSDGKLLASASADRTVQVWDPGTGALVATLRGHVAPVRGVAFSPDGKWIASVGEDRAVKVWEVARGREVTSLAAEDAVLCVAFSPDRRHLACAGRDRVIRLWDLNAPGAAPRLLRGHTQAVLGLAYSPGGDRLVSGSWDQTMRLWDVARGEPLPTTFDWGGKPEEVLGVAFSPDGKYVAASGQAGSVCVWEAAGGRRVARTDRGTGGHTDAAHGVAFGPDGKLVASAGEDRVVKLMDVATGRVVRTLSDEVHALTFGLDGRPPGPGATDRLVLVWHPAGGQVARTFRGHTRNGRPAPVTCVAFSPDGLLASTGWDHVLCLCDDTGQEEESCPIPANLESARSLAFSPTDGRLALAGRSGSVVIEDALTGKDPSTLSGHDGVVRCVAYSANGRWLASAGEDGVVAIWEAAGGRKDRTLTGHGGPVTAVAFAPDGETLASAGEDRTVRVWDRATGASRLVLTGHGSTVNGVAISPDGKLLASAGSDRTVRVWDRASGRLRFTCAGHALGVNAVAFSPVEPRLASAGEDGTIRLWETAGGQEVLTLRGHGGPVYGLAFSKDGRWLASASKDGTVKLWDGRPWK